jgi:MoxR-like ATPase
MRRFLEIQPGRPVAIRARGTLPHAVHLFDAPSILAVNTALAARRPLLVRGEPGTGKSQLARAAAEALGRVYLSKTIDSRTEARDLFWSFDAVERLAEAQVQGALGRGDAAAVRESLSPRHFLEPGVLWWAFDWESASRQAKDVGEEPPESPEGWTPDDGCTVLLDEIDKADSSVPNGCLEALGSGTFSVPGRREAVALESERPPLVVITTNEERVLPDAFLRRCIVLQLSLPDDRGRLVDLLSERGRAHFPNAAAPLKDSNSGPAPLSDAVLKRAAELLAEDREAVRGRGLTPPGQAEYLDLLRALSELARGEEAQRGLLEQISGFALRKHPEEGLR